MSQDRLVPRSVKIALFWARIRSSYWFIPTLMSLSAAISAYVSIVVDHSEYIDVLPNWLLLFSGGSDGARDVVGVIAGSIITVTGVTFSISIVILSLASQQYGPRLLRNFMRDRAIHFVFGTFIATFVYSLLVLPTIHSGNDDGRSEFIPRLSITICLLLAIICVFVIVYFIHHISLSIQASYIIRSTSDELREKIQEMYIDCGVSPEWNEGPIDFSVLTPQASISSQAIGYCQMVHIPRLCTIARKKDLLVKLCVRPGQFIAEGDEIFRIWARVRPDDHVRNSLMDCVGIDVQRNMAQDPAFGFEMLTEMAVRALSPSMNDPFTATQCIDYLRDALTLMGRGQEPPARHYDDDGNLRVLFQNLTFREALDAVFPGLHFYAKESLFVQMKVREMLDAVAEKVPDLNYQRQILEMKRRLLS